MGCNSKGGKVQGYIRRIRDVPFEKLLAAGNSAMKQAVSDVCKIYLWSPVKDVPLMVGAALNEWETVPLLVGMNTNQSDNKNFWDDPTVAKKLTEKTEYSAVLAAGLLFNGHLRKRKFPCLDRRKSSPA